MGFSVRVAVIIVREGRILLAQHSKQGSRYWVLPGGRLQNGESITDCGRRELFEEAGLDVRLGNLLYIGEFFGEGFQVLDLFFLGEATSCDTTLGHDPEDTGRARVLRKVKWHTLDELRKVLLLPESVHRALIKDWPGGFKRRGVYIGSSKEGASKDESKTHQEK
ncbi:MAG: NUDIX domain-containing protein [Candidatus Glassbacteria bacterium]